MQETRRRITSAAFELHATIGPGRTSIAAIAERAGVQRHTVYAHFPDLDSLYEACTQHGMAVTGMPDPGPWLADLDPQARLRRGLSELYHWYRANELMLRNVLQDDPATPPATEPDPFAARMAAIVDVLVAGWEIDARRRCVLRPVVVHAVEFGTWRSLTAAGLEDTQAVELLVRVAATVADGTITLG